MEITFSKKLLSIFLVALMAISVIPVGVPVSAASPTAEVSDVTVKKRFDKLIDALEGKYFTVNGKACLPAPGESGHSCDNCYNESVIGAKWFKKAVGMVPESIYLVPQHFYPEGESFISPNAWSCAGFANFVEWYLYAQKSSDEVSSKYAGTISVSYKNLKSVNAKIGNVLRSSSGHSVVLYAYNSTEISYFQNNGTRFSDGNCKITFITCSYETFTNNFGPKVGVTQAKNSTKEPSTIYEIKYDANGGTDAPSSQSKYKDETITLSSRKPMRLGYIFLGWSTSDSATTPTYSAGDSFKKNANTTLYAVWQLHEPHEYTENVIYEPSCIYSGASIFECYCGESYTDIVPPTGHIPGDWVIDEDATCTANGTEHMECSTCQIWLEYRTIPATGHNPSEWIPDQLHTCTADGTEHKECTNCGKLLEKQTVPKTGHKSSEWIIDTEATCTTDGVKHKECIFCREWLNKQIISQTGHLASEWIVDKAATCKESGTKHKECTACRVWLDKQAVPQTTHKASEWIVDIASTCTTVGSKHKECILCREWLDKQSVAKSGHQASDWIIDKQATVYDDGSKHTECETCKVWLDKQLVVQLKCSNPTLKKIENTADGVKITWNTVDGADSYAVYRKTGSKGKYEKLTTTTKTGYSDKKAKSGKKYYYIVKAVNEAGSSASSKSLSKYYLADPTLKAPKSTQSGIAIEWNKITGSDGYMVYRKTGSGSYKKIATVKGVKKVKYTDKSAKKGKTYTYKIKAYKSKTYSAYSNAKKIKDKY